MKTPNKRLTLTVTLDYYFEDQEEKPDPAEVAKIVRNMIEQDLQTTEFRREVEDELSWDEYGAFYIDSAKVEVRK
jgi:hypothetical protein